MLYLSSKSNSQNYINQGFPSFCLLTRSLSVQIFTYPGGPKTYGSGSGTPRLHVSALCTLYEQKCTNKNWTFVVLWSEGRKLLCTQLWWSATVLSCTTSPLCTRAPWTELSWSSSLLQVKLIKLVILFFICGRNFKANF
jgi:hypothetical protein